MNNTIHQERFWVYISSLLMSFNGGYINSICLVSILKNPVGYVTGNLTLAGESIIKGRIWLSAHLLLLVICFLFGSVLSGLIVSEKNFEIDGRYTSILGTQFIIIIAAIYFLHCGSHAASYFLALVMGVQNAMMTHYGTALIRTTHMTGTTTDLGILIARLIKKEDIQMWKMALYIFLITGFLTGSIVGTFAYTIFNEFSLVACLFIYLYMIFLPYILQYKRNEWSRTRMDKKV